VGSNDLDKAPHPYRDQVHIRLGHFRPRARNPRMCRGESGFPAGETISIGFGSAMGLTREGRWFRTAYFVEIIRDKLPKHLLLGERGYRC